MKEKDAKRGPPRRDETCYQVQQDIVIPAGTILRSIGNGRFSAPIDKFADFTISVLPGEVLVPNFKRVIA